MFFLLRRDGRIFRHIRRHVEADPAEGLRNLGDLEDYRKEATYRIQVQMAMAMVPLSKVQERIYLQLEDGGSEVLRHAI